MKSSRRAGFTLLEVAVATLALGSIGYVLTFAFKASVDSQREITLRASEHRVVRAASRALLDELASAGDETVVFASGPQDGVVVPPTLRFQTRIEVDGAADFGLLHLGVPRAGWTFEYAVEEPASSADERRLVRRVVDADGTVQSSQIVVRGVRDQAAEPPGFQVVKTGDLWEVTLSTEAIGTRDGVEEVFHVRARN